MRSWAPFLSLLVLVSCSEPTLVPTSDRENALSFKSVCLDTLPGFNGWEDRAAALGLNDEIGRGVRYDAASDQFSSQLFQARVHDDGYATCIGMFRTAIAVEAGAKALADATSARYAESPEITNVPKGAIGMMFGSDVIIVNKRKLDSGFEVLSYTIYVAP